MKDKIIEFFNYGLKGKEELTKLNSELDVYKVETESLIKTIQQSQQVHSQLSKELQEKEELLKEQEVNVDDLDNSYFFKNRNIEYKWKPRTKTLLRKSLNNFSQDQEYLDKYYSLLVDLGFKDYYKDEDSMVWTVIQLIYKHLNSLPNDYTTDKEAFGHNEYWLTPQEAFDYYVTQEKAGDCDDMSALLYGAITTALLVNGYSDYLWRLKRVNIRKPVGHAICAWLNRELQWKRVESTYYRMDMARKWNDESDVFKSVYTEIWHIFGENKEFSLK